MASPRVAAAARDGRALDRLVRATFGHWVLSLRRGALAPRYSAEELRARIAPADPRASREALGTAAARRGRRHPHGHALRLGRPLGDLRRARRAAAR